MQVHVSCKNEALVLVLAGLVLAFVLVSQVLVLVLACPVRVNDTEVPPHFPWVLVFVLASPVLVFVLASQILVLFMVLVVSVVANFDESTTTVAGADASA